MKTVISASRRTDLVRFYYPWLQDVLAKGEAQIGNPRFPAKTYSVDLRPEAVHSIVLWSKDFANLLRAPERLDDYNLYFHYTINNYSRRLEPNVPPYDESMRTLAGLLRRYQSGQFTIRFDPVIFGLGGSAGDPLGERLTAFERLCRDLATLGMLSGRIATSYLALYPHVRKRMTAHSLTLLPPDQRVLIDFFRRLVEIAERHGLQLQSCAAPLLANVPGLVKGRCVDGYLLEGLFGGRVSKAQDTGQREACGCTRSKEIGSYDMRCRFGCLYCYATPE